MDADTALPSPAATATKTEQPAPRRPLSLAARAALATGLALAGFLGIIGVTLSQAKYQTALSGLHDRLENDVLAYLALIDVGRNGRLLLPYSSPDPSFSRPGSGLYAVAEGEHGFHWESSSAIGRDFSFLAKLPPGETRFVGPIDTRMGRLYYYSYGVVFESQDDKQVPITFTVAQTEDQFQGENATYRRSLIIYLSTLGVMLIVLQMLLLRWSLTPLRKVAADMSRVERGKSDSLDSQYPLELTGLTERINGFIESERENLERQRNTLADLAHSLKTPIAVLRTQLDSGGGDPQALRDELDVQLKRMNNLVSYQLARAASSGHKLFSAAVPIEPHAEEIVRGLEKVYAAKGVICEFEIDPRARFHGETGDLQELIGNLLENAFKWARSRVLLTVMVGATAPQRRPGVFIAVDDDGPGIAEDDVSKVLQRGVRGDERVQGHGIGLSIVQDLIRDYRGELQVKRSEELGGARFEVRLPPGL